MRDTGSDSVRANPRRLGLICLGLAAAGLFCAPSSGAEWRRLSQGAAWSDIASFLVSSDGRYVVYLQDVEADEELELWSVRLPAGPPVRLSGVLPFEGTYNVWNISPDGARVVYTGRQDDADVREIFSVPIGGPAAAAVKLNPTMVAGGQVSLYAPPFQISPDGSRVFYTADQETDDIEELFSVPIAGPANAGVKLSLVAAGGYVQAPYVKISPDGSRVVYPVSSPGVGMELFSVPSAGPASSNVRLNGALVPGGNVREVFALSSDSARAVYRADQQTDETFELWSVPIAGPAAAGVRVSDALAPGGDVSDFSIAPDGSRVVYLADALTDGVVELFSAPVAGPADTVVRLNRDLVAGGDVASFRVSPDSGRVLFRADLLVDERFELYSVPIDGPRGQGERLNGQMVAGGDVDSYRPSPDGVWAVYRADQELDGWPTGHRAPIAGPFGNDQLLWSSAFGDVAGYAVDSATDRVTVLGNHALVDGVRRIWTYPLSDPLDPDGTDWLGGAFQPNGDADSFRLLPDGSGALYAADQEFDEQVELYVVYYRLWGDDFESGDTSRWSSAAP